MSEETTDTKSRWITLQVAVAALFVLMIVAPVFIVKFVLTPEWVDENVVPEIEKAIGREVEFEDLGLGFRGLSLKRLSVSENPAFARADLPEFASLDRLVLRVKLLPLLRRRLIISQIVLADPVIVVHRDAEGAFNFSTLGEHGETETGEGQAPEAAEAPPEQDAGDTGEDEDAGEAGLAIVAERIRLQNARVIFINETAEGRAQEKIELRRFNLVAQGFSLEDPSVVTASLEFVQPDTEPVTIEVEASFEPAAPFLGLDVQVDEIDVDRLLDTVERLTPAASAEPAEESAELDLEGYQASARLRVGHTKASGVEIDDFDCEALLVGSTLTVQRLEASLGSGTVSAEAEVNLASEGPAYSGSVFVNGLHLRRLATLVETGPLRHIKGEFSVRVEAAGAGPPDTDKLLAGKLAEGEKFAIKDLRISDGGFLYQPDATEDGGPSLEISELAVATAHLALDEVSKISVGGKFSVAGGRPAALNAEGTLDLPASKVELEVSIDEIDLDALVEAGGSSDEKAAPAESASEEIGPIDTGPLDLTMTLDVASLKAASLEITDLHSRATVGGGKAVLSELNAGLAGGRAEMTASVDLTRPGLAYRGSVKLDGVNAGELVSPFWSESWGRLSGTMGLTAKVAGRGTQSEALRNNLSGDGSLSLDEGSFSGSPMLRTLADFTRVAELADLELVESGGPFTIGGGRVNTPGLLLGGPKRRVVLIGDVGLDGALDVEARVGVSPDAAGSLPSGSEYVVLHEKDGWSSIPVALAGTVDRPVPTLPRRALAEKATEMVPQVIEKLLGGGDKSDDEDGDEDKGDLGGGLLKGLGNLLQQGQ